MARTPGQRKPGYRPKIAGSRRPADQIVDEAVTDQVTDVTATDLMATEVTAISAEEKSAAEKSAAVESATVESAAEESAAEESAAEESAAEESAAEESAAEESAAEESAAVESATENPVGEESIADDPVTDESGTAESGTAESETGESETAGLETAGHETAGHETEPISMTANDADTDAPGSGAPDDLAGETGRPTGKTRPVSRVSTIKPQPDAARRAQAQANAQRGNGFDRRGAGRDRAADKELVAARRAERGWFSGRAIVIIAGAAAVFAIVAVVLALHPGANVGDNKAFLDQAATTDLTSQAQSKFCQVQGARSKDFDKWAASARTALTGNALTQFNQGLPTIKEQFGQQDVTNDCKVDAVGVINLSGDSDGATAEVILNFVASGTANGAPTQSVIGRYQLGLVKHGDQWLIKSYADI
ncbi:hypothetical protein [Gordonia oryzae]|uniref:hypothetical protein n=1 Tax=Gordonia oryzae TaxID=2487349 RepID=UPI001FE2652F|nr:hypothetical protein [Gordonia oryzae]